MRFKNPLDIRCDQCGEHFSESVDWLMQEGRQCPKCRASFASKQEPIRSTIQDWTDFTTGVSFVVEVEEHWQIELSDEDACLLRSAKEICKFVVDSCKAKDRYPDPRAVIAELGEIAAKELGVRDVVAETDLLARFRRTLRHFTYFHGPVEEMAHLAKDQQSCSFCGQRALCFQLDGEKYGCFPCLRQGRFLFDHNTEIGLLAPAGLKPFYANQKQIPDHFNRAALAALLRTPRFTTWQEEEWLIHCNDFMVYVGEWKPKDFRRNAKDGDGRRLFLEMTDKELAHLWEEATPEGAREPEDWYATYYAFRCSRCGALRGNWDCP
ncbi:MAG TPA: CbrC family protein [Tepidisphaeraceae bacterium]|jgi:uncharacterized protein CbrC (UPF0167 family)|nr:CbrC family protein [Tepidisphaeraceae bacterium]